jgi:hypothetical protein
MKPKEIGDTGTKETRDTGTNSRTTRRKSISEVLLTDREKAKAKMEEEEKGRPKSLEDGLDNLRKRRDDLRKEQEQAGQTFLSKYRERTKADSVLGKLEASQKQAQKSYEENQKEIKKSLEEAKLHYTEQIEAIRTNSKDREMKSSQELKMLHDQQHAFEEEISNLSQKRELSEQDREMARSMLKLQKDLNDFTETDLQIETPEKVSEILNKYTPILINGQDLLEKHKDHESFDTDTLWEADTGIKQYSREIQDTKNRLKAYQENQRLKEQLGRPQHEIDQIKETIRTCEEDLRMKYEVNDSYIQDYIPCISALKSDNEQLISRYGISKPKKKGKGIKIAHPELLSQIPPDAEERIHTLQTETLPSIRDQINDLETVHPNDQTRKKKFEQVAQQNPQSADDFHNLADFMENTENEAFRQAKKLFDEALQLYKKSNRYEPYLSRELDEAEGRVNERYHELYLDIQREFPKEFDQASALWIRPSLVDQ